jgi:L-amino acid N-acyltransferase YncA
MAKSTGSPSGGKSVRVRDAVLQDVQIITEIHNQGIIDRESVLDITPHPLRERLAWFKNLSNREAVVVAEIGGTVIGFSALQPHSPDEMYAHVGVATIWIEKDFRGQGIGHKLTKTIVPIARKKGYKKFMLFAYSFNRDRMGFYKEVGYVEIGIMKKHAKIKDKFVDVLVMEYVF